MLTSAAFLPLTLTVTDRLASDRACRDTGRGTGPRAAAAAAHQVEHDAWTVWQSLLGAYDTPIRADLPVGVRQLTLTVRGFVGIDWWDGAGSAHRDRVAGYQQWLDEALAEDDGAEFAAAFAGYDEALARAVTCGTPARLPGGRPAATAVRRSGTMAGWARQARAATSRATQPAVHRATHWATSRRATN
jgi:hypothetical protein